MGNIEIEILVIECDGTGYCGSETCQKCCTHDERDRGICLECGHEEDPGDAIDRAMDYLEDR